MDFQKGDRTMWTWIVLLLIFGVFAIFAWLGKGPRRPDDMNLG